MDSKQRSVAKTALKIDAAPTGFLAHLLAVVHQGGLPNPPETDWIGPDGVSAFAGLGRSYPAL
jgi:hypothetical protein